MLRHLAGLRSEGRFQSRVEILHGLPHSDNSLLPNQHGPSRIIRVLGDLQGRRALCDRQHFRFNTGLKRSGKLEPGGPASLVNFSFSFALGLLVTGGVRPELHRDRLSQLRTATLAPARTDRTHREEPPLSPYCHGPARSNFTSQPTPTTHH